MMRGRREWRVAHVALVLAAWGARGDAQSGARGDAQSVARGRAAVVLTLPAATRAMGLGEAVVAASPDESALFYSPSELARASTGMGGSAGAWGPGATLASFSGVLPLLGGRLALGAQVLDYGRVDEVIPDPALGGTVGLPTGARVGAHDVAASAGWGRRIGHLSLGVTGKFIQQAVAELSGSTLAADVGLGLALPRGWHAAAASQHVGGDLTVGIVSAPLPTLARVGIASPRWARGRAEAQLLTEGRWARGGTLVPVAGAELGWRAGPSARLVARGSVARRERDAALSSATVGGGVQLGAIALDYGWLRAAAFGGGMHRVGIRWSGGRR